MIKRREKEDFTGIIPFDIKSVDDTGMIKMYKIDRSAIRKKVEKVARSSRQVDYYMYQLPDMDLYFGRDGRKLVCLQYGGNVVVASCNLTEDIFDENLGLFVCLVKIARRNSINKKIIARAKDIRETIQPFIERGKKN